MPLTFTHPCRRAGESGGTDSGMEVYVGSFSSRHIEIPRFVSSFVSFRIVR